jgi:hypothetical protein
VNHKKYAEKIIKKYLTENEDDFNFYPKLRGIPLVISANGIPPMLLEDENSTMLLDMDETMLNSTRVSPELMDFLRENPTARHLTPEKPKLPRSEGKQWALDNIDEFNKVLSNYKYKDHIMVKPHKVYGYAMIMFRPHAVEFLNGLEKLVGSKDLKDIQIYTANELWWAQALTDALNEFAQKKIKLWNIDKEPLEKSSKIIDDHPMSAKQKLWQAKVIDDVIRDDIGGAWIPIEPFKRDMDDKELKKALQKLQEIV